MPKLITALWLGALLGACSAGSAGTAPGSAAGEAELPCESPDQAGCAECCVEQAGPTPTDLACYRRRRAGPDYGVPAELVQAGACPATCRPCAACTRDHKKSYEFLRAKGCDCSDPFIRDIVRGFDPCYTDGCGCTCSHLAQMSECGPPS